MGRHSSHWWMSVLTLSYFEHGNQSAHYFPRLLLLQPQALNHGICLRHIGTTFPRIIKLTSYNLLWSDGRYQSSVFLRLLQSQNPSQHRASNNHLPLSAWEKLICCCHLKRNVVFYHYLEQKNQMAFQQKTLAQELNNSHFWFLSFLPPPPCVYEHTHTYTYIQLLWTHGQISGTRISWSVLGGKRDQSCGKSTAAFDGLAQLCSASSLWVIMFSFQPSDCKRRKVS